MANCTNVKFPWFVSLLGEKTEHNGFIRLCREYALTSNSPEGSPPGWYENDEFGVSVIIRDLDIINVIGFYSQPDQHFGGALTPSFLGTNYDMTRKDIRNLFGEPDQEIGTRNTGAIKHSGIDRYYLTALSVAFSYSLQTGKLEVLQFEELES